jgi:hypothetical protein
MEGLSALEISCLHWLIYKYNKIGIDRCDGDRWSWTCPILWWIEPQLYHPPQSNNQHSIIKQLLIKTNYIYSMPQPTSTTNQINTATDQINTATDQIGPIHSCCFQSHIGYT